MSGALYNTNLLFSVCENLGRRVEPDIMKHRDLPEALSSKLDNGHTNIV